MVLEIKLPFPGGKPLVSFDPLFQLIKIRPGESLPHLRHPFDALVHPGGGLQHLTGGAAAAVAVAVGNQDVVVDVLLLVPVPAA